MTWGVTLLLTATSGASVAAQPQEESSAPALQIDAPSELTPMTVNAALTRQSSEPGAAVSVLIGIRLLPGWHTYAYVPSEEPYIQTKWLLEPGSGLLAVGDWIAPPAVSDPQNPRMKLYVSPPEQLLFMHPLRVADDASGEANVRAGLVYQTCNFSRCLPPTRKTFDLKLTVKR